MQSEHKYNWKNLACLLAYGLLCYAFCFVVWTVFRTETGNGDNVEHLHATWLVAQGKVPYKDFFEHHNPFIWLFFSPFVTFSSRILTLLDAAFVTGVVTGGLTFWVVYKICTKFFASSFASLVSLLVLCPPYYYIFCFNYNPDTFMALFFAIGLYFLFSYLQKRTLFSLCFAFEAFFFAFFSTQKILIILAFLGIITLYLFYKNKVPLKDVLYALSLPILSLALFIAWLYYHDALGVYWLSNYPFNVIMQKYYGYKKIDVMDYQMTIFSVALALVSVMFFFWRMSVFYKIIAILFVVELPMRCFYFSIAPYYLLPLMIYVCCLNSVLIDWLMKRKYVIVYVFLAVGVYYAAISPSRYVAVRGTDRKFARYLSNTLTPCDYVISSYLGNQGITSKNAGYYWAMFGHVDLAGEETGIATHPDLDATARKYLPKMLYGGVYWNSYEQHRGNNVPVQQISPEFIEQYYLPTSFSDFYVLKYEYRQKDCQYDKQRKEWRYAD